MVQQELGNLVVSLVTRNALRRELPNAAVQTDIRIGTHQRTDYREVPPPRCKREGSIESVVVAMNVWISPGTEQLLNNLQVIIANCVHESSPSLT